MLGKPAAGIAVRLEKQSKATGLDVDCHRRTDADGRCRDWRTNARAGRLPADLCNRRLSGAAAAAHSIYPEISITFNCDGEAHYHLPLLLSDNSYTTYRGS